MLEQETYIVEYESNNSGGDWWLSDNDWLTLARAGWMVEWVMGGGSSLSTALRMRLDQRRPRARR